jgi:SAM-dependent methyltransferase
MPDRRRSRKGRPPRPRFEPVEVVTPFATARVEPDPRRPGGRTLLLDEHEASHVDLDDPTHLDWAYVRRIGDVVDTVRAPGTAIDAVHLGGGACTLARYVLATRPRSTNEVYELDPGVLTLAREHLGLRTDPRLRVRIGDAAELLRGRDDASADLIVGDAFERQAIPPAMTDPGFVGGHVRRVLRPGGVFVLNVVDDRGWPVARGHADALSGAFAHVAALVPRAIARHRAAGNVVLVASAAPLPLRELEARAAGSMDREEIVNLPRRADAPR